MGLGSLDSIGLAKASELATQYREQVATGIDPIEHRNEARAKIAAIQCRCRLFDEVAKSYITAHRPSWRSPVHAKQWETTLKTYASPVLGKLPVNAINTDHVMRVLEPIWHEKTDTAKRVRGKIETVLNYATVRKSSGMATIRHGGPAISPNYWPDRRGWLPSSIMRRSITRHGRRSWRSCASVKASALWHWSSPF